MNASLPTKSVVTEMDARAMVRLLADTAALRADHANSKRFLMDGLCALIGAEAWVWTLGCQLIPGEAQVYVGFLHSGFSESRFAALLEALEHPDMASIAAPFYENIARHQSHRTMPRQEIDPEGLCERSSVAALWKNADIGPLILSGYPLDQASMSGIAFYRKFGQPRFSPRDVHIAHLVLSEVPWLHMTGWPEDRGVTVPQLFPRQRMVLNLLLDGMDRAQIATHLHLKENTVAGYARDLYRHFGVHSQAKLMRKFLTETPASL